MSDKRVGRADWRRIAAAGALVLGASAVGAQTGSNTVQDAGVPDTNLNIPANLQLFGKLDPNVRKPTAIVNDSVITGTDVDQRVALFALANNIKVAPEQRDQLRLRVLQQLIDETLEIQEATSNDVKLTSDKIDQAYGRVARNFKQSPRDFAKYLRDGGSSERSIRRQIEGELAWQGYLQRKISPFVNVGDEEVKSIIDGLKSAQGSEEYNLQEIFLSSNGSNNAQVEANARQILSAIQKGEQPFGYYARSFSEASTRAQNGDLGWVRAARLPAELSGAVQQMQAGQVAGPIEVPGGYSILFLQDKRNVLTADPRDARLSLKQLTVRFPAGTSQQQATARAALFAKAIEQIHGCGGVAPVAKQIDAEVVDNDTVRVRDLPPQLQDIMLKLQVGEASPPFGSAEQGVRTLVLCGRDEPQSGELPGSEQIQDQLQEQRVNLRAQQKLRDLRRDAVIEYR